MPRAGAQIIFPESERLLGGSRPTVGCHSDSLASCSVSFAPLKWKRAIITSVIKTPFFFHNQ